MRSVDDETETSNPLHGKPEGADVGALSYLDYLQASAEPAAKPKFEKTRTEIAGTDIPASFLAESTKIYRKYPPAEAHSLFCARLNRMFEADIIGVLMREEQKRRGEAKSD